MKNSGNNKNVSALGDAVASMLTLVIVVECVGTSSLHRYWGVTVLFERIHERAVAVSINMIGSDCPEQPHMSSYNDMWGCD